MAEHDAVERTIGAPVTRDSMISDLTALGVKPGMTLLVHSSLSALGWVCGGSVAVIQALEQVLGDAGTLVMPTQSGDLSDPLRWRQRPVPQEWWETIRATMPPFDRDLTPTRRMGIIPETFRKQSRALRSDHPQVSFAARGQHAELIIKAHSPEYGLGDRSPLARIYDLDGSVLLLGVGHEANTSLHLAEYRASFPGKKTILEGAPIFVEGRRSWATFEDVEICDTDFVQIGTEFSRTTQHVRTGRVGHTTAHLMPQRPLVDFAIGWMEANR